MTPVPLTTENEASPIFTGVQFLNPEDPANSTAFALDRIANVDNDIAAKRELHFSLIYRFFREAIIHESANCAGEYQKSAC